VLVAAGLFVVMRGFEQTGAVAWIDRHAVALLSHGTVWRAAVVVSAALTGLSNLISNVPAVILWRNTVPNLPDSDLVWRVVAMSSTFAGNLLLIGSMANLIVAERAEKRGARIGFWEYARVGVPVTGLTLAGRHVLDAPVSGNWQGGATGVLLQYDEVADSDGHFVIFDREDARQQSTQFLATDAADGVATLVAP